MKTILFVVSSATSYRLHRLFARYCADQGHVVHLLYDQPPDALFAELEQDALSWKGTVVSLDTLVVDDAQPELRWTRMARGWRARLIQEMLPPEAQVYRRALGARLAAAQEVLQRLTPEVVVVAEDGISGPAAPLAAARSLGLPVVDLPYGYGTRADLDNALDEKLAAGEALHKPLGKPGRILRWLAPQWVKRGRHVGTTLFPQEYILARESLGMSLRDAWSVHGGHAQKLLVESPQMLAVYRLEGVPERKLTLTGTPYCDVMARALAGHAPARAAFREVRTIEPGKLRILVSWPTSYHGTRAEHSEFPSYEEMTRTVLGWLHALPDCELTVSLHPAIPADTRALIEDLGLCIASDYVIGLIPLHDIYISYFSSTQRWALACGKPVVNYDAYGVGLDIYDAAPGFINARRFADFKDQMLSLVDIEQGFAPRAAAQIAVSDDWGCVDGKSCERILQSILAVNP